jgi:hypothetical protein
MDFDDENEEECDMETNGIVATPGHRCGWSRIDSMQARSYASCTSTAVKINGVGVSDL